MNFLDARLPPRIWDLLQPCPMSGCWLWTGTHVAGGYGRTKVGPKSVLVHRLTYMTAHGGISAGLVVDHLCRVRCCANPAHLQAVTQQVNVLRGEGLAAKRAARTQCPAGHPLSGENLRVFERSPGRFMRTCVTCHRAHARKAA